MEKISEGNFSSLVLCDSDEIQPLQCVYVCVCVCVWVCVGKDWYFTFLTHLNMEPPPLDSLTDCKRADVSLIPRTLK